MNGSEIHSGLLITPSLTRISTLIIRVLFLLTSLTLRFLVWISSLRKWKILRLKDMQDISMFRALFCKILTQSRGVSI